MDVSLLIKNRLSELALDQKDLATAVQVTESYISQLLARKKAPPAPARTDLYEKIGQYLRLPAGQLSRLAEQQRRAELKKKVADQPQPLFKDRRELILRKCRPESREEVERIFEKEPFGEFERLLTQKMLDVAQAVAAEELTSENWLRRMAEFNGCAFVQMRVGLLEFLDTDIFHLSTENFQWFLDPIIESWQMDVRTFHMEIVLSRRLGPGGTKRFDFVERTGQEAVAVEPGFELFLEDSSLSLDATAEELEFLRSLRFKRRRPSALYYYRELQSLRDPLHFPPRMT